MQKKSIEKNKNIIISNKDILQSYIITTAKYDFSIYEKRILYRIVEILQTLLIGEKLSEGFKINKNLFGDIDFTIPLHALLTKKRDENYSQIKKAFRSLLKKEIIYEDKGKWIAFSLIERPEIEKYSRRVEFRVHPKIYEVLLNFSKGFRKYELKTAISLKSIYSMRFYEMFSEQKNTITYSIEKIKLMFKLEKKYKETKDFVKRVVLPAQKELQKSAPYSFTFIPVKTGKKITALTFTPVYQVRNRDETLEAKALQSKVDLYWSISDKSKTILQDEYKFTTTELKRHSKLFERAEKELNLHMELTKIKENALKATNSKGYIITSLKNMIKVSKNSNNSITPNIVKKQTRKTKKIKSNSIVDVEQILETKNEVHSSNQENNISIIKNRNDHIISSTNEKLNSNVIVENTSENLVETNTELMNQTTLLNEKITDMERQNEKQDPIEIIKEGKANEVPDRFFTENKKIDNEQLKNKTSNTQTENNISDTEPALSFLQKISKWIIGQFKRK